MFEFLNESESVIELESENLISITENNAYVDRCFVGNDNTGYAMLVKVKSFGGQLTMMVATDINGVVIGIKVLFHGDTKWLGTKEHDAANRYVGILKIDDVEDIKDNNSRVDCKSGGQFLRMRFFAH